MDFVTALSCAKTGEIIVVSRAPRGIKEGQYFPHMLGVLSLIEGNVFLNDTFICSNDAKETHANSFYSFYHWILMYRKHTIGSEEVMHEFYGINVLNPAKVAPSTNTHIAPELSFFYEAKKLEIIQLSSGKGLLLIEEKPEQQGRMFLLKQWKWALLRRKRISEKDVPFVWSGDHATYKETPTSVVVAKEFELPGGAVITRFYRGHGNKQVCVYEHPGTGHLDFWATDNDFFYLTQMHGEDSIISANTGRPIYAGKLDTPGKHDSIWTTTEALVRVEGNTVEANGHVVSDTFLAEWVLPHAHGLFYGWGGEIRMLVIKNVPNVRK